MPDCKAPKKLEQVRTRASHQRMSDVYQKCNTVKTCDSVGKTRIWGLNETLKPVPTSRLLKSLLPWLETISG